MDNDRGTSDLKAPVFDMESERSKSDISADETRSSSVDDTCIDDILFDSTGSDVSEDESPEFHHNDQRYDTTELNYNTMACVIDDKGVVKSCVPVEQYLPNDEKMELITSDITTIENHLRSFLGNHFVHFDFDSRDPILYLIDVIKKAISELDDYWNGHYLVTKELNRQINELNHSNTGLCHMNQEVANLYSIYVDTKFRLQCLLTYRKNELVSFDKSEEFLMKLANSKPSDGPVFKSFTRVFESTTRVFESTTRVSESITLDSESVTSYSCSDSRSEFWIDDDKYDGCESLFNTDIVDADVAANESIVKTRRLIYDARNRRIQLMIFSIIIILWFVYGIAMWRTTTSVCSSSVSGP